MVDEIQEMDVIRLDNKTTLGISFVVNSPTEKLEDKLVEQLSDLNFEVTDHYTFENPQNASHSEIIIKAKSVEKIEDWKALKSKLAGAFEINDENVIIENKYGEKLEVSATDMLAHT